MLLSAVFLFSLPPLAVVRDVVKRDRGFNFFIYLQASYM